MMALGKSKVKEAGLVEKALENKLEPDHIHEHFYGNIDNLYAKFSLAMVGSNMILVLFYPRVRYHAAVAGSTWLTFFLMCKYIARYKGTKDEKHGKKLFEIGTEVLWMVMEVFQAKDAHNMVAYVFMYVMGSMAVRVAIPKYKRSPVICLAAPLVAFRYPRFGIFRPHYEALAFFVALSIGFSIGAVIDGMRWKHFLLRHEKEIDKISRRHGENC